MTAQFTIRIKQQNCGWSCTQTSGADRVFALKEQAVQFAQIQCSFAAAEVRICDREGTEHRLWSGPATDNPNSNVGFVDATREDASIISFAAPGSR